MTSRMSSSDPSGIVSLNNAITNIYASKPVDRKRGLETLRELLFDAEGIAVLVDFNSLNCRVKDVSNSNKGKTWDSIFEAVRSCYDLQTKATHQMAFNLLQSIIKRANIYGPYLSCDHVYDFVLSKLNESTLPDGFSYGFMQLLQNLLSVPTYTGSFRSNHWKHIILTLINLFKDSTIPKTMILETLNVSIIHGSNMPEVVLVLRKELVQFYRYVCLEEQSRSFLPIVLINKGIVLLCRYNAIEFRGILCALGEQIIPSIIPNITNSTRHRDDEWSIIDVLLVQLQIHAPLEMGKPPSFYAHDKTAWDEIMDSIYFFVFDLIEEIAKRAGYTKNVKILPNLLSLAVKTTKLIHERKSSDDGDLYPQAKRQMTHKSFHIIVNETIQHQPCVAAQLVWIQYISAVLNGFPEIADSSMLTGLHRLGISLLNSSFIASPEVYVFLRSILHVEKYLSSKGVQKQNSWSYIWDIVIKSLEVNGAKAEPMEFIRSLMIQVESNINSLLCLFVENGLEPGRESLNLLSEFLSRCSLPEHVKVTPQMRFQEASQDKSACPRLALMKWIFGALLEKCPENSERDVARILIALLVKRSALFMQIETEFEDTYQITIPFQTEFEDFEPLIVRSHFVALAHVKGREGRKGRYESEGERGEFSVMDGIGEKLLAALQKDLDHRSPALLPDGNLPKQLPLLQYRLGVLIHILNYLHLHNLGDETDLRKNIADLFELAFRRYSSIVCKFLDEKERPTTTTLELFSVLEIMQSLLKSENLMPQVQQLLASKYGEDLQNFWKQAFLKGLYDHNVSPRAIPAQASPMNEFMTFTNRRTSTGTDTGGIDTDVAVSERRAIEMAASMGLQCLLAYAAINSEEKIHILINVFEDCQEIGSNFNPKVQFHLTLILELLEHMAESFSELRDCHVDIMTLLQAMCRTFHADMNCAVKIWEIFRRFAPVVAKDADENVRKQFMALIGGMIRKLNTCGIDVVKVAMKTMSILAKSDPLFQWTLAKQGPSAEEKLVFPLVVDFLKSKSQQVRLAAVALFCDIFEAENSEITTGSIDSQGIILTQSSQRRQELFELVYKRLLEVLNVPGESDEENAEESVNRTVIVVSTLVKTIFIYPYNRKRVLFSLFLIHKLKSINIYTIQRALKNENSESTKTLATHSLYTLKKWIRLNYTIQEFPFQLFDCYSLEDFYSKYRREIAFQLFQVDNSRLLEDFSRLTFTPVLGLIKECYGMIMSRLLLGLASADEVDKTGKTSLATLNATYNRLIQIFGNVVDAEDYMKECLDDVILNLISLTFDPQMTVGWECTAVRIPEPEQPFYDELKIRAGLDHLCHKLHLQRRLSVIGYLAQACPQKLYRILLHLVLRIHNAHDALEKFWRLHQYSFFVKLLLAEPRDIFDAMGPYICQFTVHSYLRLLKDSSNSKAFVSALLYILIDYVQTLISLGSPEMNIHFRAIVSQVIATSTTSPEAIPVITKLLDVLLKSGTVKFSKEISSLDPFPTDIQAFTEYRQIQEETKYGPQRKQWTLDRELGAALEHREVDGRSCTKERLRFIRQLLAQRKSSMEDLVKAMRNKRFSDECDRNKDTIHGLIQMLLGLVTTSQQEEILLEASRCLGEIGAIDLTVLVLPSCEAEFKLSCAEKAIEAILALVAENLLSDDIELMATTGEVLQSLMRTAEFLEVVKGTPDKDSLLKTNPRLCQILIPFISDGVESEPGKPDCCNPSTLESQLQQLDINEQVTYANWITQLTCGLIMALRPESSFLHRLLPLCRLKVSFCEEVLPYLVYECLVTSKTNPIVGTQLSSYFCKFFGTFSTLCQLPSKVAGESSRNGAGVDNSEKVIYTNKRSLRCLLKVIQFLRIHQTPSERQNKTEWNNNYLLKMNYLDLAKAAQFCGAYLTSILYCEIYAYSMDDRERLVQGFSSLEVPLRAKQPAAEIEKLLLKAYISIGESDAVYGCGPARYSDFSSNVQHLAQMNQWNRALAAFDGSESNFERSTGIATSLKELGLFSTLWTYLQGSESEAPQLSEIQYECAWRLSKWDMNCDKANYVRDYKGIQEVQSVATVQKSIYESIQAALNNDKLRHSESIRRGLLSIVGDLKHASLESAENLYPFLSQLQMFRIIEDFYAVRSAGVPIDALLGNWQVLDKLGSSNLKFQESVLYLRSVLLKALHEQQPSPTLHNAYDDCLLHLLWKAREAGRLELAETCAASIRTDALQARRQVEIAKNHWSRGEQDMAISILGRFLGSTDVHDHNQDIRASSLLLYGDWLSETKSENPNTIMEQYFTSSVKLYEGEQTFASVTEISNAYITLARYADSLYQNVSVYAKSEMFQEKIRTLTRSKAEFDQLQQTIDQRDTEGQKSMALLKRQISLDAQETASLNVESKRYLTIALRYYLRGLKNTSHHDLLIFRVVGLWLDNANVKDTLEIFTQEALSSDKFVIVLHQLSARLGLNSNNGVGEALQKILLTCAQNHPYHTLPVLLAQALMDKDKEYQKVPIKKNSRVDAARHLVERLKTSSGPLKELVLKMESIWIALISLANTQEEAKNSAPKLIPEDALLRKLKNTGIVPIPTISIPVLATSQYKNSFVGIHSFDMKYVLVGGMNSPKKILCVGTNGKKYSMLLKGQDDPRQDAVMQQVFAVMNNMLVAEPKTKARQLQMRTYKVVPLSQRSGVIEWCEDTLPLGAYLLKNHPHYRPNDHTPAECRKKMNEVTNKSNHTKLEVYNDIMSKFKPVFRHFFFERFKDAGTFFERRLAFTRSVATSSMVGYILGLGDRHVLNILVDLKTAEFIHIDLGVAFEQGRLLPTPETVPFRLTRDVVDGMGFCGVEGDFRRCCEMTLEVLRKNMEIILTILEVLLYDPLYMWTLSDDRVRKVQPGGRNAVILPTQESRLEPPMLKERNNSAARVLLRLRQKLVGVEEGISSGSTLGTAGHVSFLIQRACDPSRLSRLFPGWQPYL